jgi:hypothetical protein
MDINNRFSIITYVGSDPLNLMAKNPSISNDPIKSEQWDRLIQTVDTIYGSQELGGSIPVFWTIRSSVVDRFGNTSFRYIPSPDSTLRLLSSRSAYYIILRDVSQTPIKIPSNGATILGYSDNEDLPLVSPSIADIEISDSFRHDFKPQIVNLRPYENYVYSWEVVSSNWPVATNALSGTLKPASPTGTINSTIAFCPNTGDCSNTMLDYTLPETCSLENLQDPYVTLKLSIKNSLGIESLSDQFTITCKDCLPKPKVFIEKMTEENVVEDESSDTSPSFSFKLSFNNLELNQSYSYSINTVYSEWPIVFSSPLSGTFVADTTRPNPIYATLFFCPSTGLCSPNNDNIPPYTIPNYPKFLTSDFLHNIVLQASINYSGSCSSDTISSDLLHITYKKS